MLLGGCATYGNIMEPTIKSLQQGDYPAAQTNLEKVLKPTGNDRLLYYLELGVIKHLENDFAASNALLEQAERIAEDLETKSLSNSLIVMMSNPRKGPYAGEQFEKVYINYYKALNYLGLAQQAQSNSDYFTALDGARVEARRLILRLNTIRDEKGSYAEQQQANEEAGLFASVVDIFNTVLRGNLIDMDSIRYRDDAMAHYLSALSFEMNADYNNARLSYQQAAQAYEDGYAKQYRLDDGIISQAWFDCIRMMNLLPGFQREARQLAQKKLSAAQRDELKHWNKHTAQVVVLEHKGLAPQRKEMNLLLSRNSDLHAFQLRPLFHLGDEDALVWFYMLYADKGIAGLVSSYMDAVNYGILASGFTKTIFLGPLWHNAEQIGLVKAAEFGLRVTVPYYSPVKPLPESHLQIDQHNYPMLKSANPALIAVQEQMTSASSDINQALTRSAVKAMSAQQLEQVGGEYAGLLAIAGKLAMQFTDAAETRNWALLPQDIRIRRLALAPGQHHLVLQSNMPDGTQTQAQDIDLKPGDIHLWRVRTLPKLGHTPTH